MRLIILTFLGILIANHENHCVVFGSKTTGSHQEGKDELSESLPNFLILFADDLGYGDLAGTFGHPTSSTSNLKSLGAASKVFTNFYVTSPVCSPSRASLLTGKYPVQMGIYPGVLHPDSIGGLALEYETIAKKLYQKGYSTAHVGKWHLGVGLNKEFIPTEHGFENYIGIPYSHDMCPCHICFPDEGHCNVGCNDGWVACPVIETKMATNSSTAPTDLFKIVQQPADLPNLTNMYTDKALEYMEQSVDENKPFFLYMAYHQTHHPQFAGASFYQTSERGPFGDALEEMDHSIGKLIAYLDQAGIRDNTVIVFSSDNGPLIHEDKGDYSGCAGHLRCGKGTTWEGGQRVPGIISWSTRIEPGVTHALASTLDIMPTIMSIIGEEVPEDDLSYDLSDLLFNNGDDPRDVFLYYPRNPSSKTGVYAVRYKNYKAHFYTKGNDLSGANNYDLVCRGSAEQTKHDPPLLYDVNIDPGERFPINNSTELYQEVMAKLLAAKEAEEAKVGKWAPSEIHKGSSIEAEICCSPLGTSCEPFPTCCNCDQ